MQRKKQGQEKLLRMGMMVGAGPAAALPSAMLGVMAWGLDKHLGLPHISEQTRLMAGLAWPLIGLGLALIAWSVYSTRGATWGRTLFTDGAYGVVRHPQYAAVIWFLAPGLALMLNSWLMLAWAAVQLPLWRALTKYEELILEDKFGQDYRDYAAVTGDFLPKFSKTDS